MSLNVPEALLAVTHSQCHSWCSQSRYLCQCRTLDIFKDCHLGYVDLKIYSLIKFCCDHIFQWYQKIWEVSIAMWAIRLKIATSQSPEVFFISHVSLVYIRLNTACASHNVIFDVQSVNHVSSVALSLFSIWLHTHVICGTNTTHEVTICHPPFPGEK